MPNGLDTESNAENLAKPMSDMEPDQFTGWWYAWKRTGALWESPHCARMLFESKGGDRYRISLTWINSESKPGTQIMEIIDDRSVKAKFLFANDAHTVALTILDTDYENYVVLRVRLGSKDVYYYGGRSVDHVEKYDSRADEIFKNNKVTYSLHAVNQTNCPNEQKFYLP
ncbi:uncharacterized protein LOC111260479 isoform X2 [Varroa jacobsoni]|uniref:uncharacterized protein LOC111260479 isoform X2 n=1 Tax=Varroa jacobsoni TaxID=62625 RepID=UPI000BF99FBD|nr:uncharacterized protein LOC111260479 isoform X2 [Varroa jacobsoni]